MTAWSGLIGAVLTAALALIGVLYTRKGQSHIDSGELALEIAKEARAEVKELRIENAWRDGALSVYADHVEAMWSWIAAGQPPPPPPRRPVLPPKPGALA